MLFVKFLKNMQTMFTGLSENKDILNESHQIRLPLQKVQNPILNQIKASLQVSYDLYQSNTMTYDFIANSLVEEAKILGDYTYQGVGEVNTRGNNAPQIVVKVAGGAIFTGFYPNCSKLSEGEKQCIFDERKRLNIKVGGKRKSFDKKKQIRTASIKSKKKSYQKIQREISSLKAKCKELKENRSASEEADEPQENAGDQFGGRKRKKQQKSSD